MRTVFFMALLVVGSTSNAQESYSKPSIPPLDSCHSLLDATAWTKDRPHPEDSMTLEEVLALDTLFFSVNHCTDTAEERIMVSSFRMITVPVVGTVNVIKGSKGVLGNQHRSLLALLASNDLVLFEEIQYRDGHRKYRLRPLVIRIR